MPGQRDDWCAELAASLIDQPCTVQWCDGILGRIGEARYRALQRGDAPYVSYADPDDIVLPGAIAACEAMLDADPTLAAVATMERYMTEDGRLLSVVDERHYTPGAHYAGVLHVHHLLVARRAPALAAAEHMRGLHIKAEYVWTRALAQLGRIARCPVVGYAWRQHRGGVHCR